MPKKESATLDVELVLLEDEVNENSIKYRTASSKTDHCKACPTMPLMVETTIESQRARLHIRFCPVCRAETRDGKLLEEKKGKG